MKYSITKILNFGAGIYDRWAKHNLREIYKRLTELADLKGNEKVLDIGSPNTHILKTLGKRKIFPLIKSGRSSPVRPGPFRHLFLKTPLFQLLFLGAEILH